VGKGTELLKTSPDKMIERVRHDAELSRCGRTGEDAQEMAEGAGFRAEKWMNSVQT
jgi:hypothetical protein